MKKSLLFLLLFVNTFVYSQSRLGSRSEDIIEEFESDYKIFSDYSDEGNLTILVNFDNDYLGYYMFMDQSEFCNSVIIEPLNQGVLNFFVETYNKKYVIINTNKWKMYAENGNIANISLIKANDGKMLFIWTFDE